MPVEHGPEVVAAVCKAISRLLHHRLVQDLGPGVLGVAMEVAAFKGGALARLPDRARRLHDSFVAPRVGLDFIRA